MCFRLNEHVATPENRAEFLSSRSPEQLATILRLRPDARWGAPLGGLADLAARLGHRASTYRALTGLPMPGHQLLHVVVAAGHRPTPKRLLDILSLDDRPPADQLAAVHRIVDDLQDRALVWRRDDGALHVDVTVASLIDRPMNLGATVRTHLERIGRPELERMFAAWQIPFRGSADAARARLEQVLTDPDRVRTLVLTAPTAARRYVAQLAVAQVDREPLGRQPGTQEGESWARRRGLVFGGEYYSAPELPVEVLLAIRDREVKIPFTPDPPPDLTGPVETGGLRPAAAAAAGEFTQSVAALIDRLTRTPAAGLKAGGIGGREVAKIAKALSVDEAHIRFGLELLRDLGLLTGGGGTVAPAPAAANWRGLDPADRYGDLAAVWWGLQIHPTVDRDVDGKVIPAVGRRSAAGSPENLRTQALALVAELPDGIGVTGPESLDEWLTWWRPHLPAGPDDVTAMWREAHILGVLVGGVLSPLGRALLDADPAGLVQAAADLLAPAASSGRFGSDLTVMVAGSPSAAVSHLLDTCADREGRGAAVVWRFSPASVRRAFDEGWSTDGLIAALRRVADGGADLPQPLTYLITDIARRHGHLVVLPAACCVRSADRALMAEVVAHRSLRKLAPYLVTPEVATFQHSPAAVVQALRAAGYLPVPADEHGVVDLRRAPDRRPVAGPAGARQPAVDRLRDRAPAERESPAEIEAVAAQLLRAAGAGAPAWPTSPAAESMAPWVDHLADVERHQLAYAIENQAPVTITYRAATGGFSTRTISELELAGDTLYAWCHLREDQRVFTLGRIISVVPVG